LLIGDKRLLRHTLQALIIKKGGFDASILKGMKANHTEQPPWQQPIGSLLQEAI